MIEVSDKTRALLALSMLKGVGPAALRRITAVRGFEKMPKEDLRFHLPRNVAASISSPAWLRADGEADKQIELATAAGAHIISSVDTEYPTLLAETRDDPQILFVKGRLAYPSEKSVTIIGTREPTDHGMDIAQRFTNFFVGEGWSIVSGLAIGCDAIAHETALDAGGHTVAVLAHGLQTVAPSRHKKLAQRILEAGGALVTEYRFGQEPRPTHFVKRDRIQAGLAQGVVMVQSDVAGGSLHASRASIDYGRWLAIPYPTKRDLARQEPKVQGNLLLSDGTSQEKNTLLKCDKGSLRNLIVLRSRDDYGRMTRSSDSRVPAPPIPQVQGQLF